MTKLLYFLMLVFLSSACKPDLSDDAIPFLPFSAITININLPEYQGLRTKNYVYIEGGVKGILLYRSNATTYIAYERNCSYRPNDACATVDMHISNLYIIDSCCNSNFDLANGNPTGGVAWRPLRKYETLLSGSQLTITDNIVD